MERIYFTPTTQVLRGLDKIAAYMKVSVRTVRRWIDEAYLPAVQGPSTAYMTTTSLIDLWFLSIRSCERRSVTGRPRDNDEEEDK
jgi:hypothetical protein